MGESASGTGWNRRRSADTLAAAPFPGAAEGL